MAGYVGIPTSYTPVEYIESSGTQYIDTGFIPTALTKLDLDVAIISGDSNVWMPIYGARSYTTSNLVQATYFCLYIHSDSHHLSPNYAGFDPGTSGNTTITFNQRHLLTQDKGQFYIDDVLKSGISTTNTLTTGDKTLYLFTNNSAGQVQLRGQDVRLYGCKIWDNDVLVKDFIPAIDQDNVACLYDLIEGKLYYNQGTGTFSAGSATGEPVHLDDFARTIKKGYVGITSTFTPVEYIGSTGTQYIDTGFNPTSATTVEIKFRLNSSTQEQYPSIFGCQGTGDSQNGCFKIRNYNNSNISFQSGGTAITSNIACQVNTIYEVNCERNQLVVNNNTFTGSSTWVAINANIYLFGSFVVADSAVLSASRTAGDVYYCKIYDNNVLVRDFIPVLDDKNVACLYERVEGKFYYNKGTGTFTAGSTTGEPVYIGSFARKIKKGYVGVNGVARLCFNSGGLPDSAILLAHLDDSKACVLPDSITNIANGGSYVAGKWGKALSGATSANFSSGASSILLSPKDSMIDNRGSQTITFWAKVSGTVSEVGYGLSRQVVSGSARVFGIKLYLQNNSCTGFVYEIYSSEYDSRTGQWRAGTTTKTSSGGSTVPFAFNEFHHIAICTYYNGCTVFVDGTKIGSIDVSSMRDTSTKHYTHSSNKNICVATNNGLDTGETVDEIMITNDVLYTENFTPPTEPY